MIYGKNQWARVASLMDRKSSNAKQDGITWKLDAYIAGMNVRVKKKRKQTAKELTMSFIDNYYRTVKNTPLSNCVRHLHLLQGNT